MNKIGKASESIHGVQLIDLDVFTDERGELVALEEPTNLPFQLRRVFYMRVDGPHTVRANHATSSDLLVTAVAGTAVMDVDNGDQRESFTLNAPRWAVWTRPGIYIRLRDFSRSTVLLVCASKHFADTKYFGAPQPALIDACCAA